METPFLAVDRAVLETNLARVQGFADARGLALRPHVKTHKSPEIGRLQLAAGAQGITVATIGEAEVFAAAGFADLFIAYPLWPSAVARRRVAELTAKASVRIGIDSEQAAAGWAGTGVTALLEIDSGHHRSGVQPEAAAELAAAAAAAGLVVEGVFTFPGHSYSPQTRAQAGADEAAALAAAIAQPGVPAMVVSGGSTPSLTATGAGLTETRPGVYAFNDAQQWELGSCGAEAIALTAHATVVSHAGGRLILDAGSKTLGADRPVWASGSGRLLDFPQARILQLSEHHAVVDLASAALPALGSRVRVVPNHACNAVALADQLVVFEGGQQREIWPVAARGRNS